MDTHAPSCWIPILGYIQYEVEKEVPYRKPHFDENVESMFWSLIHIEAPKKFEMEQTFHEHTCAFIMHKVI